MRTLALAIATTAIAATAASAMDVHNFDGNGDGFATYSEITAVNPTITRQQFRNMDVNRDNRLSATEIDAAGAEATLNRGARDTGFVRTVEGISGGRFASFSELEAAYPGLTRQHFRDIDVNRDNRVSAVELYASEAQAILKTHQPGTGGVIVSMDVLDTDGSGFASLSELQSVYTHLDANDLRQIDVNRDGRLSFAELYAPGVSGVLGENE